MKVTLSDGLSIKLSISHKSENLVLSCMDFFLFSGKYWIAKWSHKVFVLQLWVINMILYFSVTV
jgi:hypothetical protein